MVLQNDHSAVGWGLMPAMPSAHLLPARLSRAGATVCRACGVVSAVFGGLAAGRDWNLEFSRLGRRGLAHQPVDLAAVVRQALHELTPAREGRTVQLSVGDPPRCRGHGSEALDYLFGQGAHAGRDVSNGRRIILLDLKLPKVDGLEVLRRLKGDLRTTSSSSPRSCGSPACTGCC